MTKSKAWNWTVASAPWWEEPASEIYPLLTRWQKQGFNKLLDLGCGIGRHAVLFAKNGFKVDASDLSQDGIRKLNNVVKQKSLEITTKVADMLSLPYEDKSFDCLIAFHAVYHTNDTGIGKTISEIKRVLKREGEAFVTFNSQNSSDYKDRDNKHLTKNTIVKSKGHEAGIPHYYASKDDIEKLLAGFEIIEFSYKEEYYSDYTGAHYFVLIKNSKQQVEPEAFLFPPTSL